MILAWFWSPCLQAKKNAVLISSDQLMAFRCKVSTASPGSSHNGRTTLRAPTIFCQKLQNMITGFLSRRCKLGDLYSSLCWMDCLYFLWNRNCRCFRYDVVPQVPDLYFCSNDSWQPLFVSCSFKIDILNLPYRICKKTEKNREISILFLLRWEQRKFLSKLFLSKLHE